MYYHVMVSTPETNEIYGLDKRNLREIENDVVMPYLQNEVFQFSGYFIEPSQVNRMIISKTEQDSDFYENIERDAMRRSHVFAAIDKGYYVTEDAKYCDEITKKVMKAAKARLSEIPGNAVVSIPASRHSHNSSKTVFLAYSYRADDEEFVSGFQDLLKEKGWKLLDGKADRLGSVSQAILEKISLSDYVVLVMTKRDKKENGQFTTAAWLLQEAGAALALGRKVVMLIEEGIDPSDIGGLQGDDQRFPFTRNNFLKVAMNVSRIMEQPSEGQRGTAVSKPGKPQKSKLAKRTKRKSEKTS